MRSSQVPGSALRAALTLATVLLAACGPPAPETVPEPKPLSYPNAWLEEREEKMNQTVWAKEMLAQECGLVFDSFWNALNAATNKLSVAAAFPLGEIALGQWETMRVLPHAVQVRTSRGPGPVLQAADWRAFVEGFQRQGWQLSQTEFRHCRFDLSAEGRPRQSRFYFSAHLTNSFDAGRAALEGDLIVDWAPKPAGQPPAVQRVDARPLIVSARQGVPPFQPAFIAAIAPKEPASWIDPLIVHDLEADGLPEIILLAANLIYRRDPTGSYTAEPLLRHPPALIFSGLVADFDQDGRADLLCAVADGLVLFHGSAGGTFAEPGETVWEAHPLLINPMALTCGDIDGDGDLDVFLGQYRLPTLGQIFRPNYHNANDGYPWHLLVNDGRGHFTNATAAAGLDKKRRRRVFSASWVDLDNDGHLDLAVVSDFAGIDLYRNDGHGRFTDVTDQWIPEAHAFGMSQVVADFNRDGRLDLLMIGMNSPTVDRLDHLGLTRSGAPDEQTMRTRMSFGNRLYLARPDSGFEQTALNDSIARSGWSWAGTTFDWDNDGYPDVYVSNGQDTRSTVREYEPEFWLHHIYIDDAADDAAVTRYFMGEYQRTRGQGWSYGGYEKNRLFWNQQGTEFKEVGHLLGVALEEDSRCVVSTDLEGDGRMDLLVITRERWPGTNQTLRVYRNTLADAGNWIGFRLRDARGAPSVGARVTVQSGHCLAVRHTVAGDSFRSQQSSLLQFGLGAADRAERVEIRWPDGTVTTMKQPAINRYHVLTGPGAGAPSTP
jgi:hypothetical protein